MHKKIYDHIVAESDAKEIGKYQSRIDVTDTDMEGALLNLIIKERLPISIVDSKHLRKLIQGICCK